MTRKFNKTPKGRRLGGWRVIKAGWRDGETVSRLVGDVGWMKIVE